MEEQLVRILNETQSAQQTPRKNAEWQLKQQYSNADFPSALINIAAHNDIPTNTRQSALLVLKTFVQACWSAQFDEYSGQLFADHGRRAVVRQALLDLALNDRDDERKVKSAASLVVSKIATADFPDEWPDLLPKVLNVVSTGSDGQLRGALKVLGELVDDCFNEEQFFSVARELVRALYDVAVNENRRQILRALAVSVFRSCFDTLEMIMEDHKAEVKSFAEQTLVNWIPFFISTIKATLPVGVTDEDENNDTDAFELHRGVVALKLQAVKVLMRIRSIFPSTLTAPSQDLFSATWQELSTLQPQYYALYIEDDRQGRLEDADGLPYTLDFLVLEELDFLQACLRAPPVRRELEKQLQSQGLNWVTELIKLAAAYSQITTEEEGLWDIDVNIFLSEEANVTANYTPRTACGDLVAKLGEWLNAASVERLLAYTRTLYTDNASWKLKEAVLYLLSQVLADFQDVEKKIGAEAAKGYVECIQHAMQEEPAFLRARGYLVAGSLTRSSGDALQPVAASFMQASLQAIDHDASEIVKVSAIRALQYYLAALPASITVTKQAAIISALSSYLGTQDVSDLTDSDDLLITIIETLRDTILKDTSSCLTNGGLDLLFTIASKGASNFQIALMVTETFEEIASTISAIGAEQYALLTSRVVPSLNGAFDIATLTEENALANLSAELLAVLTENGTTPMPPKFVSGVMPRLNRLLLGSQDEELLKAATKAVKEMLSHDPDQVFDFQDENGKGGLEVVLVIIDRLLNPAVDDNAASEIGGLAAEVVEKAGSGRLGPYLTQLLRAVAMRLASAQQAAFIQSLILVFARLSITAAQDVVTFLADIQVDGHSGLHVVISKWLENSITFAGYDDIRQNVIALTKIYALNDPRLTQIHVKGDLLAAKTDRIMTRSRARAQPDTYTSIPAQLKIIKVLIAELLTSSGGGLDAGAAADLEPDDGLDEDDEDGDWEDDGESFVDLGTGMSKAQLMAFGAEDDSSTFSARGRDDETQRYLLDFFRAQANEAEFGQVFAALTPDEQERLRSMADA
ncbi:hypothetical protein LTR62_005845 [Meristemomyces frigidus]|uniref:Importin N-terminal domain-containing protein n=1 Tax=Meristemomyces frigidus TaxID=1508187 RepID=A0AAN7THD1_9PEZI|nr:hypothetical protein LTR62_005845 [Meristemomyces frigidus]